MAGWHRRPDAHGFGWTPGVGDGQGGLVCCGSWGRKESDTTERLNRTELVINQQMCIEYILHLKLSACADMSAAGTSPLKSRFLSHDLCNPDI